MPMPKKKKKTSGVSSPFHRLSGECMEQSPEWVQTFLCLQLQWDLHFQAVLPSAISNLLTNVVELCLPVSGAALISSHQLISLGNLHLICLWRIPVFLDFRFLFLQPQLSSHSRKAKFFDISLWITFLHIRQKSEVHGQFLNYHPGNYRRFT